VLKYINPHTKNKTTNFTKPSVNTGCDNFELSVIYQSKEKEHTLKETGKYIHKRI
jgi:hypothetical protein